MNAPLFKMGQRVYNRANPYHGKVIGIRKVNGEWSYTLALDLPNPSDCPQGNYFENGLRATLEEALAWQEEFKRTVRWACGFCLCPNENGAKVCQKCGRAYSESFPNTK